jgi:mono/diheme cytochrome c family protein
MRWTLAVALPLAFGRCLSACADDPLPPLPAPTPEPLAPLAAPPSAPLVPCQRRVASSTLVPLDPSGAGGALVLAKRGAQTLAFAADADGAALRIIDLDTHATLSTVPLAGSPAQLLITRDGRVIVALRDRSLLEVLEPVDEPIGLRSLCTVPTPSEPVALASASEGDTLLVASRWGHALSGFSLDRLDRRFTLDLPRDPSALAVTPRGERAFVAHAVGGALSVVELSGPSSPSARALPLRSQRLIDQASLCLKDGSVVAHPQTLEQSFSLLLARDGRVILPAVLVDPWPVLDPVALYAGRWWGRDPSTTFVLATLLPEREKPAFARSPAIGLGDCLLPRAAALDDARDELLVTCLGRDELVAYDARPSVASARATRRWKVASGPTGLAVDPDQRRAVVWSQFDGVLSLIALDAARATPEPIAVLDRAPLDPALARGRKLFHGADSSKIAFDGRACASCHVDGRDDALTWVTKDGPRQTPMLLGRLTGTEPYGWLGESSTLAAHFRTTLARLGGTGLSPDELHDLFAWVTSLRPPSEPAPPDGALVARGEALFRADETSCSSCHTGELTTDRSRHDVMTGSMNDAKRFDVPSLRFIGKSAPYLHDGRYATLRALLDGMDGKMGFTKHLSSDDRDALAAYLESL